MTVQKIVSRPLSAFDRAVKYYSIMAVVNNIPLTKKEIQLLAFIATRGTISAEGAKETFSGEFDSSVFSVNNMIYRLRRKGVLIKNDEGQMVVNPRIVMDFSRALVLNITMANGIS